MGNQFRRALCEWKNMMQRRKLTVLPITLAQNVVLELTLMKTARNRLKNSEKNH